VEIAQPNCFNNIDRAANVIDVGNISNTLALMCRRAALPGIGYMTSELTYNGNTIEVPYLKQHETITLTFYVDSSLKTKYYFDNWMDSIQLYSTKGFGFYKDYTTKITINVLTPEEQEVYAIELDEAYPKAINMIELDYGSREVMELQVTFAYKSWSSAAYRADPKKYPTLLDELFGNEPWYQGSKQIIDKIGSVVTTVDEYTGRFERLKGMGQGFVNQAKGIKGIFKSKTTRIKDLGKWL
jgi:hypothetical protein